MWGEGDFFFISRTIRDGTSMAVRRRSRAILGEFLVIRAAGNAFTTDRIAEYSGYDIRNIAFYRFASRVTDGTGILCACNSNISR